MDTCLFTGEELGPETNEEHTIPEKLAGRVKSRRVSSSTFNGRCSAGDAALVNLYDTVLVPLRPLLPTDARRGFRDFTGRDGLRLRARSDGGLELEKKVVVKEQDATGTPTKLYARNETAGRELLDRKRIDQSRAHVERQPETDDDGMVWSEYDVDLWLVEVAALKSAMLSLDEKLADDPPCRFTRHPSLDGVREFVRAAIMDNALDHRACARHVMGLQYDKMPEIEVVRYEHGPRQRSEFEHVLVASGNTAERRLDVVWWVAGIDPFGYRLSHDWREYDFTCLIVSGMLKGESCSEPIWVGHAHSICAPTGKCAVGPGDAKAVEEYRAVYSRHLERMCTAHQRAIYLVEMEADDHVKKELAKLARHTSLPSEPMSPNAILAQSLRALYDHQLRDPLRRAKLEAVVATHLPTDGPDAAPLLPRADLLCRATWAPLLPRYRQTLNEVKALIGLPGHLVDRGHTVEAIPVDMGPRQQTTP